MGYTHYWYQKEIPEDKFVALRDAVRSVIEMTDVVIVGEHGDSGTSPELTNDVISFNGLGEEAYETFYFQRAPKPFGSIPEFPAMSFCKTQYRPYDSVVIAALCLADYFCKGLVEISSDGDANEWVVGLELARTVVPDADIPETVKNR